MEAYLMILLKNADALRAKGVLRVKCGDFEADLAPTSPSVADTEGDREPATPTKRGLREIMGVTRG